MSIIRQDPLSGRWVIFSEVRSLRPDDFIHSEPAVSGVEPCPFCEGNERQTTPEITAIRPGGGAPNSPGWTVRVVSNKFPALERDQAYGESELGPLRAMTGAGYQEVIIESPKHGDRMSGFSAEKLSTILELYRDRLIVHYGDPRIKYVQIFRNDGREAGASLVHPHSQLMAMAFVPPAVEAERHRIENYRRGHGGELIEHLLRLEIEDRSRVVDESEDFLTFVPYAARVPHELWIAAMRRNWSLDQAASSDIDSLAAALQTALRAMQATVGNPSFNLIVRGMPAGAGCEPMPWRIELLPRTARLGGFEFGTDCYVNSMLPEHSARELRAAIGETRPHA